jgi:hypothetical protein
MGWFTKRYDALSDELNEYKEANDKLHKRILNLERDNKLIKSQKLLDTYKDMIGKNVCFYECMGFFGVTSVKTSGKLLDITVDANANLNVCIKNQGSFVLDSCMYIENLKK